MPTFTALVEYLLCFHAWCHYSSNLPIDLQEDFELIAFSLAMVVQYFDTIIYHGDDSVDTDTCKIHSQLHHSYTIARFGDPMQYNTEVGERGLREWAKRLARTALKHGRDKFTESTSDRVKERLLFNTAADRARWTAPVPPETEVKSRHKMPHFRFEQNKQPNLRSLGRNGEECSPDEKTGTIQPKILKALNIVESHSPQAYFEIWCEAKLANGQYIRCWPRYHGTNRTQYYDWAMVRFDNTDDDECYRISCKGAGTVRRLHQWKLEGTCPCCSLQDGKEC